MELQELVERIDRWKKRRDSEAPFSNPGEYQATNAGHQMADVGRESMEYMDAEGLIESDDSVANNQELSGDEHQWAHSDAIDFRAEHVIPDPAEEPISDDDIAQKFSN